MCALWMSRFGVKTRLVDKRGTKVFNGCVYFLFEHVNVLISSVKQMDSIAERWK